MRACSRNPGFRPAATRGSAASRDLKSPKATQVTAFGAFLESPCSLAAILGASAGGSKGLGPIHPRELLTRLNTATRSLRQSIGHPPRKSESRNPKSEIRNNIKIQKFQIQNETYFWFVLEFSSSVIRICFGFRISRFGFCQMQPI